MPNRNDSYLGRPAGDASQYLKPKSHEIIKPASAAPQPAKAASWASAAPTPAIVALAKSLANDLGPYYRWQNIAERIEEATETRELAAELERVKVATATLRQQHAEAIRQEHAEQVRLINERDQWEHAADKAQARADKLQLRNSELLAELKRLVAAYTVGGLSDALAAKEQARASIARSGGRAQS